MTPEEMKARLLAADDEQVVAVPTPEWAKAGLPSMHVRALDGHGRDRYDQHQAAKRWPRDDKGNPLPPDWSGLRAILLAMSFCTEAGELLGFSELEVHALGKKSGAALDRCFETAQRISGLTVDAVENEEKN
jgi:hypothetical protein